MNRIERKVKQKPLVAPFDWLKARKSPVYLEWLKVTEKDNYKPKEIKKIEKIDYKQEIKKEMNKDKEFKPVKSGKKQPKTNKK